MDTISVEIRRLLGKDATKGLAARYIHLMDQLSPGKYGDMRVGEMVRYIAGSVPGNIHIFGAFAGEGDEEKLVAVASIFWLNQPRGWEAQLHNVVIDLPFRGRGIFHQLMDFAKAFAADGHPKTNGRKSYKMTFTSKPGADDKYLKEGFVPWEQGYRFDIVREAA